jgi:hypothetical protein
MKQLMVLVLAGCFVVLISGFSKGTADDDDDDQGDQIPLRKLAGTYAFTSHGSLAVCMESAPPHAGVTCGSPNSIVVPLTLLDIGVVTRDDEGNSCGTTTETGSDLPVDVSPPTILAAHFAAKTTSYDSTTGTGDESVTGYVGGQCHGSTFDPTGATAISTLTTHIAASDHGKRVDFVITSVTTPAGSTGDFSISGTILHH